MSSKCSVQYAVLTKVIYTLIVFCTILAFNADNSFAQGSLNTPGDGVKFEDVKSAAEPVTDWLVAPFYYLVVLWEYMIKNPSFAIMFSGLLAALFTRYTIHDQRERLRLKETFNQINRWNWDSEMVRSLVILGEIKQELSISKRSINEYVFKPDTAGKKGDIKAITLEERVVLDTIMNDYEHLALSIKRGLFEEEILFQWMRGALIEDWKFFHPFINELRRIHGPNNDLYILFENLAKAWEKDVSSVDNKKLKRINLKTTIS